MEIILKELNSFTWFFWGVIVAFAIASMGLISSYFKTKRLRETETNIRLSFSKAAFFAPTARMLGVEYCWIRFARDTGKTTVKRLSIEGEIDEEIVDDADGKLAQQYARRLEDENWTRVSSGQVNKETWETYHQRKKEPAVTLEHLA